MIQLNNSAGETTRSRKHDTRKLLAAALALALGTVGGGAQAATQLVTNCQDLGSGSLRAAITAAMSGDIVDATGLTCSTITLSTGALAVTANSLTIKGAGPNRLTVENQTKYSRVFGHLGNGTLALQGLTITGGVAVLQAATPTTKGGCIYSKGTVTLGNISNPTDAASGVVVTDCRAISTQAGVAAEGGGIFAQNGVSLWHSKVSHSQASAQDQASRAHGGGVAIGGGAFVMRYSEVSDCAANGPNGQGGGVYAPIVATVTVDHSTIAGNSATNRAGGAKLGTGNGGGLVLIANSTISGNSSASEGGALLNIVASTTPGAIHIYSSTITGNRSSSTISGGVGGASVGGDLILQSTIVSGNLRNGVNSDLFINGGRTVTGANNLVGVSVNAPPPASGLITATDPKLAPLSNRGGFTRVHLSLANSPAINAGNNTFGSNTDQRGLGFPRVIGSAPDIGAVEFDPDRIFNNGFD